MEWATGGGCGRGGFEIEHRSNAVKVIKIGDGSFDASFVLRSVISV